MKKKFMVYSAEEVSKKLKKVLIDDEQLYIVSVFETDLFGNDSISQQHNYLTLDDVHTLLLDLLDETYVTFTQQKNSTAVFLGVVNKNSKLVIMSLEELRKQNKGDLWINYLTN
jgi:hypothetical protein